MPDKPEPRNIAVFIASPGDLAVERRAFRDAIEQLNAGFADGANVSFEALGWEDTLASTGRRSQSVINKDIDLCDVFILTMHRRWGQAAPDAGPYSSYTEEEFHRALERWQEEKKPEIFVFLSVSMPHRRLMPDRSFKECSIFAGTLKIQERCFIELMTMRNLFSTKWTGICAPM